MGWREKGVFMSEENTARQLSITRSGRASSGIPSRASQGVGQGRKVDQQLQGSLSQALY